MHRGCNKNETASGASGKAIAAKALMASMGVSGIATGVRGIPIGVSGTSIGVSGSGNGISGYKSSGPSAPMAIGAKKLARCKATKKFK